jgi:RNA-binding protein
MAQHKDKSAAPARPIAARTRDDAADALPGSAKRPLTAAQTRFLRGQAHGLKALLQVGGKGVTPSLLSEVGEALENHELIKVKIAADDREARASLVVELVNGTGAALVQRIGHTAVLYRPSREKRQIVLPRA